MCADNLSGRALGQAMVVSTLTKVSQPNSGIYWNIHMYRLVLILSESVRILILWVEPFLLERLVKQDVSMKFHFCFGSYPRGNRKSSFPKFWRESTPKVNSTYLSGKSLQPFLFTIATRKI